MNACKIPCHQCIADFDIRSPYFPDMNLKLNAMQMILCDECGNKRCPKAENHRYKCTGSNEPGQIGVLAAPMTEPRKETE